MRGRRRRKKRWAWAAACERLLLLAVRAQMGSYARQLGPDLLRNFVRALEQQPNAVLVLPRGATLDFFGPSPVALNQPELEDERHEHEREERARRAAPVSLDASTQEGA